MQFWLVQNRVKTFKILFQNDVKLTEIFQNRRLKTMLVYSRQPEECDLVMADERARDIERQHFVAAPSERGPRWRRRR